MKQILFTLSAILIAASSILLSQSQLERARELLDQKKSAEAIALCQSFVQSNPRKEEGWLLLAKANQQAGNLDAAEEAAKRSVSIDDELMEGYVVLTQVRLAKKDWIAAYTSAQTGIAQTPRGDQKNPQLLVELAWSLLAIDSVDAAIVAASQARELEPNNPTSYEIIGSAYLMQKQAVVMAINNFEKSLEINPMQIGVLFKLADAYSKNRQYTESAKTYNRLIELDPNNCNARLELAKLLYRAKQYAKCVKVLEEFFAKCKSSDKEAKKMYIGALLKSGQYDQAFKEAQEILKAEPNSPLAYRAYANEYFNKKQYAKAVEAYNKLKKVDTLEYDDYRFLGYAYSFIKEDSLAAATWEEIVKDTSQSVITRSGFLGEIGSAWMRDRSYERAADAYKRRMQLDPSLPASVINYALSLIQLQKYDEAVAALKEAKEKNPNYPPIYNNLGYCYFQMKEYEAGRREYEMAIKVIADSMEYKFRFDLADAYRMIGLSIMLEKKSTPEASKKKWEDAIVYLKKSLKYKEDVAQTHFLLGQCYQNLNEIDDAIKEYRRTLAIDPKNKDAKKYLDDLLKLK